MKAILSIIVSLILLMAANRLGALAKRILKSKECSGLENFTISTALGIGILSLIIFAFGVFQLYGPIGRWILLGAILAWTLFGIKGFFVDFKSCFEQFKLKFSLSTIIYALIIIIGLIVLISALAPSVSDDWDSLAYHLSVPKLFLNHGGIYYINFTTHSNFPLMLEILYIPGLILNLPVAGKIMHFWAGILLILTIVIITKKHFNPKSAPLAALAVVGVPIILWEATTAYIDLATALYTMLAVLFILNYFDSEDMKDIIGCGLSIGFAASTKLTSISLFALLIIWLLIDRLMVKKSFAWKPSLVIAGMGVAVCFPWYLKSLIYTGNPVFPFFYSLFGGKDWSQALADNYSMLQTKFGMGHSIQAFLQLPYNLAAHSEKFYDIPGLFVGPIMIIAAFSLLLLLTNRNNKLLGLAGFFVMQVIIWFALTQQSRYLIPVFATAGILCAAVAYNDVKQTLIQYALIVIFAGTVIFGGLTLYPLMLDRWQVVAGQESYDQYLERRMDTYQAVEYINQELPENAKIALFGDTRGFYLNRKYVWADWGHNALFSKDFNTPEELISYLKKKGITNIMVSRIAFPPRELASGTALRVYEGMDKRLFEQIYPDSIYIKNAIVYKVR